MKTPKTKITLHQLDEIIDHVLENRERKPPIYKTIDEERIQTFIQKMKDYLMSEDFTPVENYCMERIKLVK